jgi:hypothetical protein
MDGGGRDEQHIVLQHGVDATAREAARLEAAVWIGDLSLHQKRTAVWIDARGKASHLSGKGVWVRFNVRPNALTNSHRSGEPFGNFGPQFDGIGVNQRENGLAATDPFAHRHQALRDSVFDCAGLAIGRANLRVMQRLLSDCQVRGARAGHAQQRAPGEHLNMHIPRGHLDRRFQIGKLLLRDQWWIILEQLPTAFEARLGIGFLSLGAADGWQRGKVERFARKFIQTDPSEGFAKRSLALHAREFEIRAIDLRQQFAWRNPVTEILAHRGDATSHFRSHASLIVAEQRPSDVKPALHRPALHGRDSNFDWRLLRRSPPHCCLILLTACHQWRWRYGQDE